MIDADLILEQLKERISDLGVFSEDQVSYLQAFADDLSVLIDAKIREASKPNIQPYR